MKQTDGSASSGFLGRQSAFYRNLAAIVRIKSRKHIDSHTKTAFSYGDRATFASEMLLDQLVKGIEVSAWSTLEFVELAGPRWMASDGCIEACGTSDQLRTERGFGRRTDRMSQQAGVLPSIREDFRQ